MLRNEIGRPGLDRAAGSLCFGPRLPMGGRFPPFRLQQFPPGTWRFAIVPTAIVAWYTSSIQTPYEPPTSVLARRRAVE